MPWHERDHFYGSWGSATAHSSPLLSCLKQDYSHGTLDFARCLLVHIHGFAHLIGHKPGFTPGPILAMPQDFLDPKNLL